MTTSETYATVSGAAGKECLLQASRVRKKRLAAVYLNRDPDAFRTFLVAYDYHSAGTGHDLVVVNKGAARRRSDAEFPGVMRVLNVSDFGLALCAFGKAVKQLGGEYALLCLLNSWSRPVAHRWLAKLAAAAEDPAVGLAGATGSWESFAKPGQSRLKRWLFPPFPNPHVRATSFCARAELLERAWPRWPYGFKWMEHLHEIGRRGLSRRCEALGLRNVVVGRDGKPYHDYRAAGTYRFGDPANLLVADNQTDRYRDADAAGRADLERRAWGGEA